MTGADAAAPSGTGLPHRSNTAGLFGRCGGSRGGLASPGWLSGGHGYDRPRRHGLRHRLLRIRRAGRLALELRSGPAPGVEPGAGLIGLCGRLQLNEPNPSKSIVGATTRPVRGAAPEAFEGGVLERPAGRWAEVAGRPVRFGADEERRPIVLLWSRKSFSLVEIAQEAELRGRCFGSCRQRGMSAYVPGTKLPKRPRGSAAPRRFAVHVVPLARRRR